MGSCLDFLEYIGPDISIKVVMYLDDPADLVRVSAVSRSWRSFVIANFFCKNLCTKMFPEISCFTQVAEEGISMEHVQVGSSDYIERDNLERENRVYARLAQALASPMKMRDCILESISASSTDNYPDEAIENTLDPNDRVAGHPSYWSSEGESNREVPETLTYRLSYKLCVVDEIKIQPFQAYFQFGHPIYSSQAVRFKMGHSKMQLDITSPIMDEIRVGERSADDDFIWTYVSPKFPMEKENQLQSFKLPQPVVCIGGILQIELLGRVQKQEMDGLFYICVCHVKVLGKPLPHAFDVGFLKFRGECVLKYLPRADCISPRRPSEDEGSGNSGWLALAARIRQLRQIRAGRVWNRAIRNIWLGNMAQVEGDNSESDEEPVA